MLECSFYNPSASFNKELNKLLKLYPKYREAVKKASFAGIPWEDFSFLKNLPNAKKYTTIVIVGIGGSSLGAKAALQALTYLEGPKVIFLDNIDPDFVRAQVDGLSLNKTFFICISKSGETIEVLALTTLILSKKGTAKNIMVITDNPKSTLGKMALKHKLFTHVSSKNIPGRFSVLSSVGLAPLYLSGAAVEQLREGAKEVAWRNAFSLACTQYLHFKDKKNIAVLFSYSEQLAEFGNWYIQLLSESIGKTSKIGITPVQAIGVRDQHSQLQLFLDGPDDKFYIFIKPDHTYQNYSLNGESYSLNQLFDAEYEGVKKAFVQRKRPYAALHIPKLSEPSLGALFFFFELEVAFLGALFKVNAENQPAVELSKRHTQNIIASFK